MGGQRRTNAVLLLPKGCKSQGEVQHVKLSVEYDENLPQGTDTHCFFEETSVR